MSYETVKTGRDQSGLLPREGVSTISHRGSDGHIPILDGVRGVTILLVLILHFSTYGNGLAASAPLVDRLYYRIAGAGWIGVHLFFVLSGFLITGILYTAKGSE